MSSKDIYNSINNIDIEPERWEPSFASVSKAKIIRSFNMSAALNPIKIPNFFRYPFFPSLAMEWAPPWKIKAYLVFSDVEEQFTSGPNI